MRWTSTERVFIKLRAIDLRASLYRTESGQTVVGFHGEDAFPDAEGLALAPRDC